MPTNSRSITTDSLKSTNFSIELLTNLSIPYHESDFAYHTRHRTKFSEVSSFCTYGKLGVLGGAFVFFFPFAIFVVVVGKGSQEVTTYYTYVGNESEVPNHQEPENHETAPCSQHTLQLRLLNQWAFFPP